MKYKETFYGKFLLKYEFKGEVISTDDGFELLRNPDFRKYWDINQDAIIVGMPSKIISEQYQYLYDKTLPENYFDINELQCGDRIIANHFISDDLNQMPEFTLDANGEINGIIAEVGYELIYAKVDDNLNILYPIGDTCLVEPVKETMEHRYYPGTEIISKEEEDDGYLNGIGRLAYLPENAYKYNLLPNPDSLIGHLVAFTKASNYNVKIGKKEYYIMECGDITCEVEE